MSTNRRPKYQYPYRIPNTPYWKIYTEGTLEYAVHWFKLTVFFLLIVWGINYARFGYGLADSTFYLILGDSGTTYAPGFSESKFSKVNIGLTEAEVLALLGPPLGRPLPGDPGNWWYTQKAIIPGARGDQWHLRILLFTDGKVTGMFHEFYID